ncbi:uncharacterized protein PV09_06585 [Verruconis gallopava]|uniref:Uncharacterized protein n=1 Tax=Verruconis gallopava TaxID=253628 RepID=A0A0D2A6B3_9PEZI|nr:uncharacterized protein PV09_06585 [Verruconis gallopava]KIW02095.1 hypothetical protein PV09_06585 [Verruconis gallopava]
MASTEHSSYRNASTTAAVAAAADAERYFFPLKNDVLERKWMCEIKPKVEACLRNEGIWPCIRTVHLCRLGRSATDSKVVARISHFRALPARWQNPALDVARATYEDVLGDVFAAYGLEWELVRVKEAAADTWAASTAGGWRDFTDPNDPLAPR